MCEYWRLKQEVSWVRLLVTAGLFTFLDFRTTASKFLYSAILEAQDFEQHGGYRDNKLLIAFSTALFAGQSLQLADMLTTNFRDMEDLP